MLLQSLWPPHDLAIVLLTLAITWPKRDAAPSPTWHQELMAAGQVHGCVSSQLTNYFRID